MKKQKVYIRPKATLTYKHINGVPFYWDDVRECFTDIPMFISFQFANFIDDTNFLDTQLILAYAYLSRWYCKDGDFDLPTINVKFY